MLAVLKTGVRVVIGCWPGGDAASPPGALDCPVPSARVSNNPLWYIAAVPAETVARGRPTFERSLTALAADPSVREGLRRWSTAGDIREHLIDHETMQSNEMVGTLGSLFWRAALDWDDICDFFWGTEATKGKFCFHKSGNAFWIILLSLLP